VSLWTPSGEHRVDPKTSGSPQQAPSSAPPASPASAADPGEGPSLEDLSPEQRAQVEEMARQMEEAQARMLQLPAGTVIGQQALQFYELAAVYLSQDPPRLTEARIAIDALAAVVERLGNRLGEAEPPLRQALNQVQLAFIEITRSVEAGGPGGSAAPAASGAGAADEDPAGDAG
jgi:hypothetical protein